MAVGVEVNEPLALRPWDYPEVTRMLLGSDGSTSLLESVAGGRLTAVLDHEEVLAPAAVPTVVREALGLEDPAAPLLLRLTRLVTRERLTVSSDRVYLAARDAKRLLPSDDVPLLRFLARERLSVRRRPLSFSARRWPHGPAQRWSVGRDYLIDCEGDARIWVSEQFSPDYIPAAAAPSLGRAPDLAPPVAGADG
ncbi:hypothetical protein OG500_18135 [Kitasatospora sp. NBC_01250]|uniref:hypothetical protein n=1 Tax=Kitasatospora sp. NBC_01250 TaxID=2903571 RepID=UPI002E358ADA|nr:hypothetical protein [Kitasatospora sp. NBC_01250]